MILEKVILEESESRRDDILPYHPFGVAVEFTLSFYNDLSPSGFLDFNILIEPAA